MTKTNWMALVACCLLVVAAVTGHAQTDDGPYIIVDSSINANWGNVFQTLAEALTFINDQPNGEEMAGATIILYPGVHNLPVGIVINVPGLHLVSRDGANRTIIRALAPVVNALTITAAGVVIEGVTIQTLGANGIDVRARDCALKGITVEGSAGFVCVNVAPGGDNLLIESAECVGGNIGIQIGAAGPIFNTVVSNSVVRSSLVNGIDLADAHGTTINTSSLIGSIGNGLNVAGLSTNTSVLSCEVTNNAANGINVASAFGLTLEDTEFGGNTGNSIALAGTREVSISDCVFDQTGGTAVLLGGACSDIHISGNSLSLQAAGPFPSVAIDVTGVATNCQVVSNSISGYHHAIRFIPAALPRDILIAQNTISNTLWCGLLVQASAGNNEIRDNTILGCGGNGIHIEAANADVYLQNVVTACTLSGIAVDDASGAFNNLRIADNTVLESGQDGIHVFATVAGSSNVTIAGNEIRDNDDVGISINLRGGPFDIPGLRIVDNLIADNEQQGLWSANAPGCEIAGNAIARNLNQGVFANLNDTVFPSAETRILQNSVYDNAGGGIQITWLPPVVIDVPVIEENLFVGNQGFAISLTGAVPAPIVPGPLPYPYGMSLASNWWGSPTGPAGFFGGTGNALLGLPATSVNAAAPVLTAPAIASAGTKMQIIEYAQVSVIPSFASSKVNVNRLDTSGLRIAFSEVEARASGLVNTGRFTDYALGELPSTPNGEVACAVAVLLSGFDTGVAEVALAFDPSEIEGKSPDELVLVGLEDATWVFDEEAGTWTVDGGTWVPLIGCLVPGANLISAEIPVSNLRGKYIALALVLPGE